MHDTKHITHIQTASKVLHRSTLYLHHYACRDESKEELQSYYKLIDEDMEEITKEWPTEFLVPVEYSELSNLDIIESPLVTWVEHDGQTSTKKKKKKEEVQNIEIDEEDNASRESRLNRPQEEEGMK
jgi:hypothetical protein